jgi:predicted CoA-binding protein
MKRTVIVGASTNPGRYAYMAGESLTAYNHEIVPIGIKRGMVFGTPILDLREKPAIADVDTITLYIGPRHQPEWYDYLIGLKPKRIIFNPGTENPEFEKKAEEAGIFTLEACTLVMLRTGQY